MKSSFGLFVILPLASAINIIDFESCSIPYIIPLSFQRACDLSDEYLMPLPIEKTDNTSDYSVDIAPPANISAASIRSRPNLWTYEPFCLESLEANQGFCVYTSNRFAGGRGISIVTTPAEMNNVIQASVFKELARSDVRRTSASSNAHKQRQQQIPGKGLGVIANATLHRGEVLQAYTPVLLFQDDMMQFASPQDQALLIKIAVERLPKPSQTLFLSLQAHFSDVHPYLSRIQTNAFSARAGSAKDHFWAMIPEASRYNHDCRPSASYYFDADRLAHMVHVLRPISVGEEISVSYTHATMGYAERQALISEEWGFSCSCSQCTSPATLRATSDHRLHLIKSLTAEMEDLSPNRTGSPAMAEANVDLYEQEHLHGAIADAYVLVALEYAYLGDRVGVLKWATRAVEALALWRGEHHESWRRVWELMMRPEEHEAWRYTVNGFTTKDGGALRAMNLMARTVAVAGG